MVFGNKRNELKKTFLRSVFMFVCVISFVVSTPEKAHAQWELLGKIFDGIKDDVGQIDWDSELDSLKTALKLKNDNANTNTNGTNMMQASQAGVGAKIGADSYIPPNRSSCEASAGGRNASSSSESGGAVSKAMTMANANRPDDPVTNAKFISLRCKFNFAPGGNASTDPKSPNYDAELAAYQKLNCTSNGSHAHEDEVLDTLLNPLEYPADPQVVLNNNNFTPPQNVPADKYYPFDAALFFCMNVNPPQPIPPQAPTNGGQATTGLLALGPYNQSASLQSIGASACFRALERRAQYGADNKTPALYKRYDPISEKQINYRHDEQVVLCSADLGNDIIDSNTYADCQQNGRSDLQAEHDKAYRRGSPSDVWWNDVLSNVDLNTRETLLSDAMDAETNFETKLSNERLMVINGITNSNNVGHSINNVSSSAMSQPVSK